MEKQENLKRSLDPYSEKVGFSVTTFDHFSLLARNHGFSDLDRKAYKRIQKDIRAHSQTSVRARIRDLSAYVQYGLRMARRSSAHSWQDDRNLEYLGKLENIPYHILRKIAGIGKLFHGSDGKHVLRSYFDEEIPFFRELLSSFDTVYQFGRECEEIIRTCLENGQINRYEVFPNRQLPFMACATCNFLKTIEKRLENKTFLQSLSL